MAVFFVVTSIQTGSGSGTRVGKKEGEGHPTTSVLLEGPFDANIYKVEAASLADAQKFVKKLQSGGGSVPVVVTEAQWKES